MNHTSEPASIAVSVGESPEALNRTENLTKTSAIDSDAVQSDAEDDYVARVLGDVEKLESAPAIAGQRTGYAPWHHPVKQIVRDYQWADLVKRLVLTREEGRRGTLRYFTLPGADLLDVRVLADALEETSTQIEYFGFDSGYGDDVPTDRQSENSGAYLAAESALRQAGRVSGRAEILSDRLEDIALDGTHAAERLRQRGVFDVINIDACNHLGYAPTGRTTSIFDAMEKLLAHQLRAEDPWLLFVTTRANVELLGGSTTKLQGAIHKNLELHPMAFATPLAECIGGATSTLAADMNACWSTQNLDFLKLFSVGIGKYLLQYFHAQPNLPARVELVSAFAYKVAGEAPDMLSLAFRIHPRGLTVQPATAGGATIVPFIELAEAIAVVTKAKRLWDLDEAIASDPQVRADAIQGTERLLRLANYSIPRWRQWLRDLPIRPMELDYVA